MLSSNDEAPILLVMTENWENVWEYAMYAYSYCMWCWSKRKLSHLNTISQIFDKWWLLFSEKCSSLSESLSFGVKTITSLPVDHGTLVEVDCIPGYSLSGSRLITCIRDRNWLYGEVPDCILGRSLTDNFQTASVEFLSIGVELLL